MSIPNNSIQEIYCDESGYTGNNLLDQQTPFFAYAAVAVSHEEAKSYVNKIIKDHNVQADELKFTKLVRYNNGKKAIKKILMSFSGRAKVVIHHKKYSLACKFFEYIFEPAIASKNSFFYNIGFHRFVANLLYFHFQNKNDCAEEIYKDFYALMKRQDTNGLSNLFSSRSFPNLSLSLDKIRTFCVYHQNKIIEELDSLDGTDAGKWILDLTNTSLFSLLGEWGNEFNKMQVFCDLSMPLQSQLKIFDAMINQDKNLFLERDGKQHSISFNLASTPKLVNSKDYPGVQIADILAGAFTSVYRDYFKSNGTKYNNDWAPYIDACYSPYSVMPDFSENLNWENIKTKRNYLILEELIDRSIDNFPLLDGLEDLIADIDNFLYFNHST